MSPHLHITIVGLALLSLNATFIIWTIYKMKGMTAHIHLIEDFVKFYAEFSINGNNPQRMIEVYNEYQEKVEA
jgi:hypothetical protein